MSTNHEPAATLTDADYRQLAQFRYLLRQFLNFSEDAAESAGLTAQQHQALLAIRGFGTEGGMTTGHLAERLGVRPHSAVGLVDRLEANHLIRRRAGSEDRRQVLLELTREAEAKLAQLSAAHRDELERLAPTLRALLAHFEPAGERSAQEKG